jgi:hypothetical protein
MEDLTGRQFGPYRIVSKLGEGGMATVFKAFQSNMEREVAVKVLPKELAQDPTFTGRFRQEAMLLAKLQHPHILSVFDFGEADGYTYLVMPFIRGGTLAGLLSGQPMPMERVVTIFNQLGSALDYAHTRGLIHRDIKPSNVLLDEQGNCLLSDFGIAKMVEGTAGFTLTGSVVGTPDYMSPEQGRGEKLTHRSDIYSLGVVLYELATGRVPFKAETPIAVIIKHIQDPLPIPRTINPDLSVTVERVILKALAKNPEDRYSSAGGLASALQAAIKTSLPGSASKTSAETIAAPLTRQPGRSVGWMVGAAVAVLGMLAVTAVCVFLVFGRGLQLGGMQPISTAVLDIAPATRPETPLETLAVLATGTTSALPVSDFTPTARPPTETAIPTPTFTATPPLVEENSVGSSVQGKPLAYTRLGNGRKILVVAAALHGSEKAGAEFVRQMSAWFENHLDQLPPDTSIYFLPVVNPDGLQTGTRLNAHKVDLNRNWQTLNWQTDANGPSGIIQGSGGVKPFSEPETRALAEWLQQLNSRSSIPMAVIFYHIYSGSQAQVLPAYTTQGKDIISYPPSVDVGQRYADASGSKIQKLWTYYSITGEAINWCGENQLACMDIELPKDSQLRNSTFDQHINGVKSLLNR